MSQASKLTCMLHASAEGQPPAEAWRLVLHSLAELDLGGTAGPPSALQVTANSLCN